MTIRQQAIAIRRSELLTVGEYAALMRLSERTVYRLIWSGLLPGATKVGGQWRIDVVSAMSLSPLSHSDQTCTVRP